MIDDRNIEWVIHVVIIVAVDFARDRNHVNHTDDFGHRLTLFVLLLLNLFSTRSCWALLVGILAIFGPSRDHVVKGPASG